MEQSIIQILSKKINKDLIEALMKSYDKIQDSYLKEDYEETLSKSGKFVENVFRILYFIITKSVLTEIKSGEMEKIAEKLEKSDGKKFSETIRIVIPRIGKSVYTMRSKLGAEHVKPINPDFIDARFTVASCDWILAELLRSFHIRDPSKVDELIQKVKSSKQQKLESFEIQLASQIDKITVPDLITIILRTSSSLTKSEIIEKISDIGRNIDSWFAGGNLNSRLLKKGIVKKVGKKDGEYSYSLTTKGLIHAEKLIDMIKTSTT